VRRLRRRGLPIGHRMYEAAASHAPAPNARKKGDILLFLA